LGDKEKRGRENRAAVIFYHHPKSRGGEKGKTDQGGSVSFGVRGGKRAGEQGSPYYISTFTPQRKRGKKKRGEKKGGGLKVRLLTHQRRFLKRRRKKKRGRRRPQPVADYLLSLSSSKAEEGGKNKGKRGGPPTIFPYQQLKRGGRGNDEEPFLSAPFRSFIEGRGGKRKEGGESQPLPEACDRRLRKRRKKRAPILRCVLKGYGGETVALARAGGEGKKEEEGGDRRVKSSHTCPR